MYRVLMNGKTLHDPRFTAEYQLESATLTEQLNTQGSFSFNCPYTNDCWSEIAPRSSLITIELNGSVRWEGRVISVDRGWENRKICHAEGILSYMQDCILEPFAFKGSPRELIEYIVGKYNAQRNIPADSFTVGRVTVTDPNGVIVRSSNSAQTIWDALSDKCFNSTLGGYIRLRGRTIDWLADFTDSGGNPIVSNQSVEFGQNLIDLAIETNADSVVTCLIPYGKQFEESQGTPPYEPEPQPTGEAGDKVREWNGNRLTVASVNSGSKILAYTPAVNKWGRIYGTKVWGDITEPSNLKTAGNAWLQEEYTRLITSVEATSADLSILDPAMDEIVPGVYVKTVSKPNFLDELLLCTSKTTDLVDPSNTSIQLGIGEQPLSSIIGGVKR